MPDFINQQIPIPANWQDFERLCADLFERIWEDPNTQLNGRGGQAQHGVDVYGRLNGDGDWQGVQCKGKDGRYGRAVSESELKKEVDKAKKFTPRIKAFILATAAPSDGKIQRVARHLTEQHEAVGLFSINVLSWDEIVRRLAKYPEVIAIHFPGQSPAQHRIEKKLDAAAGMQMTTYAAVEDIPRQVSDLVKTALAEITPGSSPSVETLGQEEQTINGRIDACRDLIQTNPRTALRSLEQIRDRQWGVISNHTRFRLATNIGAAYLELAEWKEAADHFIEAVGYAEEDNEKAIRNVAYAHLINDDLDLSKQAAERAIALNPEEKSGYAILIAANVEASEEGNPESLVPEKFLAEADIAFSIGHVYRRRKNFEKSFQWFKTAYEIESDSHQYRASYGSELLSRVIDKPGATLEGHLTDTDLEDLERVVALLSNVWEEVRNTERSESYLWVAVNLCSALSVLKRSEETRTLVSDVVALGYDAHEIRKIGALEDLNANNPDAALEHLSHVITGSNTEIDLIRAEALAQAGRYTEAFKSLDAIEFPTDEKRYVSEARVFRIRLIEKIEGPDAALKEIESAQKEEPNDLILLAQLGKLTFELGDGESAKNMVLAAHDLLNDQSSPSERMIVATALFELELYSEAIEVYGTLINNYQDSQILQRYLICCYHADQRRTALDALGKLPSTTRVLKFYRHIAAAFYMRSGELEKALEETAAYLAEQPNDLDMRLKWVGIHQRLGHEDEIINFLSTSPDFSEANPEDRVSLAHLLTHYGFPDLGLDLAYRLRREHPEIPKVHLGYIGLFVMGRIPEAVTNVSSVGADTAFVIEDAVGRRQNFIIEDRWKDRGFSEEIQSSHPIALAAAGKSVGDTIKFELTPLQTEERKIVGLSSKYGHIYSVTATEFQTRFPEEEGFWNVDVSAADGDGFDFAPLFRAIDDRQSHVGRVEGLHQKGPLPIGVVASLLGAHPLEVWANSMQGGPFKIKCCEGNEIERRKATELLKSMQGGLIIDALTLYTIFTLGVHEVLVKSFGQLCITQSTLDMYKFFIDERRAHPPSSSIGKIGGQYTIQESTEEQLELEISKYEAIANWAKTSCKIIPATGNVPAEWQGVNDYLQDSFVDTILAAKEAGKLLLSDDQILRNVAAQMLDVDGIWLQISLMVALERKHIQFDQYCDAVAALVEAGIEFITVDHRLLFVISENEDWIPTEKLQVLLAAIGGKNVDRQSSINVAVNFLSLLWSSEFSNEKCAPLTEAVISAVTDNHQDAVQNLLQPIAQVASLLGSELRSKYLATLKRWCDEHSFEMPRTWDEGSVFKQVLLNSTSVLALNAS